MSHVIVAGALANKPGNGGNAWTRLNWVLGLRKLGFEVHLLEQISLESCVDEAGQPSSFEHSFNLSYFRSVCAQFGLQDCATLLCDGGEQSDGLVPRELTELAQDTALLINIGGHLTLDWLRRRIACAAYVDDDPGYTQFWHTRGQLGDRLANHAWHFTIGTRIGQPDCPIPATGIDWRPLRPLVSLDHWPVSLEGDRGRLTTVASWRGAYGAVEHEGQTYGLKVHEFRKLASLPSLIPQRCEIALDIHPSEQGDIELLRAHGWQLVDPHTVTADPTDYQRYLAASGGEVSAAQGIYVHTRSGWFSDRTACYLASGRPALVQDTGFDGLPVGEGLVTFHTLAEAVEGAKRIARDYEVHCEAARAIAEQYFDSQVILTQLLDQVDVPW